MLNVEVSDGLVLQQTLHAKYRPPRFVYIFDIRLRSNRSRSCEGSEPVKLGLRAYFDNLWNLYQRAAALEARCPFIPANPDQTCERGGELFFYVGQCGPLARFGPY